MRLPRMRVRRAAWIVLLLLCCCAALMLLRSGHSPVDQDREHISAGHSALYLAGTDDLGRDRALRLAAALLLGLAGAGSAAALATLLAVSVGVAAAFAHPFARRVLLYVSDLFLTLPWLFLLMMVRAGLPLTVAPAISAGVTFLLLGLLGWPSFARFTFVRARDLRDADWMLQGIAGGLDARQLARWHVLPNLLPLIRVQFLLFVPAFLVAEANLGTLGLGVSEPLPSWGSMLLAMASTSVVMASRWALLPLALLVAVLLLLEVLASEPA